MDRCSLENSLKDKHKSFSHSTVFIAPSLCQAEGQGLGLHKTGWSLLELTLLWGTQTRNT